ncbi:MAG: DUF2059 domain-containing protein [Candidatus Omnitrophota bacterium]
MKKFLISLMAVAVLAGGTAGVLLAQADTHQQAAEDFLIAMKTPEQLQEGIDSMVDLMLQAQPMMMPYRQTIKDFYNKYLSWESLKGDYTAITVDLFTEDQLKEITNFFKTEVGQQFIEQQPEMFERTSELGFRIMQEHQEELLQILQTEAEKYAPAPEATPAPTPAPVE